MAVPVRKVPAPRAPAERRPASGFTGWIAVMLSIAVSSFVAVFAGAESAANGAVQWGEAFLLALVIGSGLAAVLVRNGGAAYALFGAIALIFLDGVGALLVSVPMMTAGVLFLNSVPRPRALAVWLIVGTPVLVAIGSAIATRLTLA